MDKKVIHSVFEEVVKQRAAKTAIETAAGSITYGALNTWANRLAHLLPSIGVKKEQIVHVLIPSSVELVAALLAVFKAGCIYLPVDTNFSAKRISQVYNETFEGTLITTTAHLQTVVDMVKAYDISVEHLIVVGEEEAIQLYSCLEGQLVSRSFREEKEWQQDMPLQVNGDSSNYIFYTSGSTGDGKAILGKHAGISHFVHWEIKEFGIDEQARVSQLAAFTFDASLRDIFTALIAGGTLYIPAADTRNNPGQLLAWIQQSRITLLHSVPSLFRVLTKQLQQEAGTVYDFSSLRHVALAGELLYAKDILSWQKIAGTATRFVNFYGPTETTLIKTFYPIVELPANPAAVLPVGKPISNTSVAIVKNGQLCGVGDIGEIYIKTPFATKGYYNNQALTDQVFVQNPLTHDSNDKVYKTGDMGRYLPDGNMEVLGRLDNQVKVNGIRVELGEIEKAMLECANITGAVAKVHRSDDNLSSLIAYYTGTEMPAEELARSLAQSVNAQAIPSFFVYLDKFPVNINGKVDKKALPVPEDILFNDANFEAPVGAVEEKLAVLWREILGLKKIGRHISFFSIGGHSLRAIQLISRIHKEFNASLKIADVFNNKTIRELALLVATSSTRQYDLIPVATTQASYPLSSSQRRLWVLSQLEAGNKAYNISGVHILEGMLDTRALSYAFQALIDRHEILRTVFRQDAQGAVRQMIQPAMAFNIHYHDLQGVNDQEAMLHRLIQEEANRAFDLATGPLLRASIYSLLPGQWVFSYVMHHIISDGWSMNVLIKELLDYYNAHITSQPVSRLPLRIQYKDYANWQQELLSDAAHQVHQAYWLQKFSGELPVLELPGDRPRPAVKSYAGQFIDRVVTHETVQYLQAVCQEEGATVFMALVAIVNALLYRYTNQADVIIGSPVAGRDHLELEDQIGFYVNTLVLRTNVQGRQSFRSLLQQVKANTLEAYEHQSFPFDELVNHLQLQRDMSRHPLFDVVVVLQNTQTPATASGLSMKGLTISSYPEQGVTSKFDLTFNFLEQAGGGLQLHVEYNTDIYTQATAERLVAHFCRFAEQAASQAETTIDEIDYLTAAEKQQLLIDFNSTPSRAPVHKTVVQLWEEQVRQTPDRIALIAGEKYITYQQLNEWTNRLAGYLKKEYQLTPGDLVAMQLERDEWLLIAIIGILKAGAAYLPVDKDYPATRVAYILQDSQCKTLIDKTALRSFQEIAHLYRAENIDSVNKPGDLAYVLYTSGSTGTPKGVMVAHQSIVRLVKDPSYVALTGEEVLLSTGAVSFDAVTFEYWSMLLNGGTLVMCPEETLLNPILLAKELQDKKVDTIWFTAGWLNQLVESDIELFKGIKTLLAGGDKLSPPHINRLLDRYPGLKIINGYGPTENTTFSLTYPITEPTDNIPIGKPIDHSTAYILDQHEKLVPIGVIGEIYMGGLGVALGYLGNEELSREKFVDNPFVPGEKVYRSGDLGRWMADGNIEFIGRKDDQVKIRGYRIELGEVEMALQEEPGIASAVVLARAPESGVKELVAYIVSHENMQVAVLRASLATRLPAYMVPQHFVQLEALPLNANGKVDKKKLPAPFDTGLSTGAPYIAARNDQEKQLTEVFEELLRKKPVSIKDDFFVLGGDSIKSIQVAARLKQRGYAVSIQSIMLHPVIEELAPHLQPVTRQVDQEIVTGTVPLGPIQHYFLGSDQPDKHHFNQSVLLESKTPLSVEGVKEVLDKIVLHHDALRSTFTQAEGGWIQKITTYRPHGQYALEVVTCKDDHDFQWRCEHAQTTFDLSAGPLVKAVLFRQDRTDLLLIVIHHLVVDGVSWRILLEDLATAYQQYTLGEKLSLPVKTASFQQWQEQQVRYARSESLQQEDAWWRKAAALPSLVPTDHPGAGNLEENSTAQTFSLGKESTTRLLTTCYKPYHTGMNDILLTALGMAMRQQFGMGSMTVLLEGHGREQLGADLDVSRTVGWFTSMYPVLLPMNNPDDPIRQLIETKETIHRIPNKGIGFGILKYLAGKDYSTAPGIRFNYLGDFDGSLTENNLFHFAGKDAGKMLSGKRYREHLLDVSGIIVDGSLQISVSYSALQYEADTIRRLLQAYEQSLQGLVEALAAIAIEYKTPVDLQYKDIAVDRWLALNRLGNIQEVYPLSPLQEGMMYEWLRNPAATAFFEQMSFRVQGKLDTGLLESSYRKLLNRHAILRSNFKSDWGEVLLQVVQKEAGDAFAIIDMTGATPAMVQAYKDKDIARGFNLQEGALMRLAVLLLDDNAYELVWSHHHILMDGWCVGILIKEFFHIYYSLLAGQQPVLDKEYPYANYIAWLQKVDTACSLEYWQQYLQGAATVTGIPPLGTRTGEGYRPCQTSYTIAGATKERLRAICRQAGVTENIFIQAVWSILLSRYSNTRDVLMGTVVSGRPSELEGVEAMIGLFINTVPLRVLLREDQSFRQLLQELQQQAIASTPHHYSPLADVQQHSEFAGALFDHVLVFENYPVQQMVEQQGGERHKLHFTATGNFEHTNYDLSVLVLPGEATTVNFSYNGHVYAAWQMENLKSHFDHIVQSVVENADNPVTSYQCLNEQEQYHIRTAFNDTEVPYPRDKTLVQLWEAQVQATPANTALIYGESRLTYEVLNQQANLLAHHLRSLHQVQADDIIGIQLGRNEWSAIAMLGVLKSGAGCLMIDANYPAVRAEYMAKDSGCTVVIDDSLLETYRQQWDRRLTNNPVPVNAPDNLAAIIYTSGSTGQPKGVALEHRGIINHLFSKINTLAIGPASAICHNSALHFVGGIWQLFAPWVTGGKVVLCTNEELWDIDRLLQQVAVHKAAVVEVIPSQLNDRLAQGDLQLPACVKTLILTGEKLNRPFVEQCFAGHPELEIINTYGQTELSDVTCSYSIPRSHAAANIFAGRPIQNTRIYVLSPEGDVCPMGVVGEVCTNGDGLSRGYVNDQELTAKKFVADPARPGERMYRTGDLARWWPDGELEVLGRIDQQVKIRGYRVEVAEIEQALNSLPGVVTAIVVAGTGQYDEKELIAYFVGKEPLQLDLVRAALQKVLPSYMVPAHLVQLERWPLTPNGKVDKKQLPRPGIAGQSTTETAPWPGVEQQLADIWELVLQRTAIHRASNFFDLGGHSLKLTRLANRIHKTFGISIGLQELFTTPVLANQAMLISGRKEAGYAGIRPAPEQDAYPVSSSQRRLWVVSQFEESNIAYNIPGFFKLEGPLDPDVLYKALQVILQRHEILRTAFSEDGHGAVQQYILPAGSINLQLPVVDLQQDPLQEERLRKLIAQDAATPFNLEQPPLLRAGLYRMSANEWVFTYIIHHIVSDDWSINVLVNELLSVYHACQQGVDHALPPLPIQYKDYAVWQQAWLQSPALQEHEAYWRAQFAGVLPVLQIPTGRPRPAVKTYAGAAITRTIDTTTYQAFTSMLEKQGATLFMGLVSLVNALLQKLSGQADIILGSPVAGRDHLDLENQVGFYVNTIALKTRLNQDESYYTLLQTVRDVVLGAYEHQAYPFDNLVDLLGLTRDPSRNFLFDAWLVLHNTGSGEGGAAPQDASIRVSRLDIQEAVHAKFDILFSFAEADGQLYMDLEYNTDIFTGQEARQFAAQWERLLYEVTQQPGRTLAEQYALLDTAEKEAQQAAGQKIRVKNLSNLKNKHLDHAKQVVKTGSVEG